MFNGIVLKAKGLDLPDFENEFRMYGGGVNRIHKAEKIPTSIIADKDGRRLLYAFTKWDAVVFVFEKDRLLSTYEIALRNQCAFAEFVSLLEKLIADSGLDYEGFLGGYEVVEICAKSIRVGGEFSLNYTFRAGGQTVSFKQGKYDGFILTVNYGDKSPALCEFILNDLYHKEIIEGYAKRVGAHLLSGLVLNSFNGMTPIALKLDEINRILTGFDE